MLACSAGPALTVRGGIVVAIEQAEVHVAHPAAADSAEMTDARVVAVVIHVPQIVTCSAGGGIECSTVDCCRSSSSIRAWQPAAGWVGR